MRNQKKSFRSAAPVWAAFTLPIVWLAVLMASCYEPGMTIFTLMDAFSAATKNPFSLHWTPYTMKFIGIFLLLYGGAILFITRGKRIRAPARNMALRRGAVSGNWTRSTATRMQAKTSY